MHKNTNEIWDNYLEDVRKSARPQASGDLVEYSNPFDWKRPENIDKHPARYSPLRDAIEGIISTRLHQNRVNGYVLEMSLQIMDAIDALSRPPQPDTVTEAQLREVLAKARTMLVLVSSPYWQPMSDPVVAEIDAALAVRGE